MPKAYTQNSIMSTVDSIKTENKGIGRDRAVARLLNEFNENKEANGRNNSWAMVCQQIFDNNITDGFKVMSPRCRSLLNLAATSEKNRDSLLRDRGKRKAIQLLNLQKNERSDWLDRDSYVKFGMETDMEVKRRTNFNSEIEMMAYVIVVCNADWEVMIGSCTKKSDLV